MGHNVRIAGENNSTRAKVTKYGQLVVAPLAYSNPIEKRLSVVNVAYNFIEPIANESIVITDIIVFADKSVSATAPANIQVYQSDEVDSLNVVAGIVTPQLTRGQSSELIGLNLKIPDGRWVNAVTDDNEVLITIMYYRVPQEFV